MSDAPKTQVSLTKEQIRNLSPGSQLDGTINQLIDLQLLHRGVDIQNTESLKDRFRANVDISTGNWTWTLDGKPILKFERNVVTQGVLSYTLMIERLIHMPERSIQ